MTRPHGLTGEVIVELVTNRDERLDPGSVLVARREDLPDRELAVVAARRQQRRFIVAFDGVSSRDDAEELRGTVLAAEPIADPDAMFVHELVGCELVERSGVEHGRVVALQPNPASDLLVGEGGWLVPLRFVVERRPGVIVVDVPAGLFETT